MLPAGQHPKPSLKAGHDFINLNLSQSINVVKYCINIQFNPNGSFNAIEGITSPDGRVLGKMGHSERIGNSVAVNVPGKQNQLIFEAGVNYYS